MKKHEKEAGRMNRKFNTVKLSQVTLQDAYCVNALEKEIAYLLEFDPDRLLAGFRETAGIDMRGAVRYQGWESFLIGGHTLGHYLTACAQGYAGGNISDAQRDGLYKMITTLIDGLKECQENSKGKPGYIFGADGVDRNNVEKQFDHIEKGECHIITQAWVPWYTMHKILQGLVDVYRLTGYEPAKEVASKLGDWTYGRTSSWDDKTHATVLSIEYGGMNDCLYDLYSVTGKWEHATAAHAFDEDALFERVYGYGENVLNNKHANTTIPKFMGALNRYCKMHGTKDDKGEVIDASKYLAYAEKFWDMVIERHTYVTGGNSEWEHFGLDYRLDKERTSCNCETCNTYNMLKMSSQLYCITGKAKYAEYYENAYINTILSSQNPATGMTTYFQPMATGYFKVYGEKFDKFWCCTGSGMENFTKLGSNYYYVDEDTVYAALFVSSVLDLPERGVKMIQESEVLVGGDTKFTIKGDATGLKLAVRIPSWETAIPCVRKNGTYIATEMCDGYMIVDELQDGDVVEVDFHMAVTAMALPDADNVFAFRYGPIVLSALLGTDKMWTTTTGMFVTVPGEKQVDTEVLTIAEELGGVEEYIDDIADYMEKDEDGLRFTLKGVNKELVFVPHFTQHKERYGLYWYFVSYEESLKLAEKEDGFKFRVLDTVQPGYGQYENDELHAMRERDTVAVTSDGTYRYAKAGGSFSYRMVVNTEDDTYLQITLRKEDNGKPLMIYLGCMCLYHEHLQYEGNEDTYMLYLKMPLDEVNRNRVAVNYEGREVTTVWIRFEGFDGQESARVCDFIRTGKDQN